MSAGVVSGLDRGLAFGDGLFETLFVRHGRPVALAEHMTRLRVGLARLGLPEPEFDSIMAAIDEAVGEGEATGVCKLVVTAGAGPRGYRRPRHPEPRILASFGSLPPEPPGTLAVDLSPVVMAGSGRLRGLKHLNRLVQVLAQEALPDERREALMTDDEGRVVSGTMSNLFWREGGRWHTPPLVDGAIAGTRRAWLIEALDARITPCAVGRLALADAAFLSNALSAWRPIERLLGRTLGSADVPDASLTAVDGFWQPASTEAERPWPDSLTDALNTTCWGRTARREGVSGSL
ncbi:aminotransferase class IV [Guyparkeria hydrothermalis]|uniref:aminotransferase class IV n=1 Tax=Guyparkeria hydrothermalis TaxID=923 RepID=UPI002020B780|nr:aminotransferase class IV [Guyparkeria hydrothermalis]MCL7743451.1 aminotransferase class IV [Guyparkeria hydrothermalis]